MGRTIANKWQVSTHAQRQCPDAQGEASDSRGESMTRNYKTRRNKPVRDSQTDDATPEGLAVSEEEHPTMKSITELEKETDKTLDTASAQTGGNPP